MTKFHLRCALFSAAASICLSQNVSCLADEETGSDTQSEADKVLFDQTTEFGILFLNHQGIAPPYRVVATSNSVVVNEVALKVAKPDAPAEPQEFRRQRPRPDFQRQGRPEFAPGRRGRGPRRNDSQSASLRMAKNIFNELDNDAVVVAFDEQDYLSIGMASQEVSFYEAMLSENPKPEQVQEFLEIDWVAGRSETFESLLRNGTIPTDLRQMITQRLEDILEIEREGVAQMEASLRLDRLAYPLTVVGIIIGVIAFGHMLQWSARGITAKAGSETSVEVDRFVIVAIRLMLAMSALDLVWTILAGQAGAMKEVNPFAADLISSPLQLAIFKVIATGIGLGIVYMWRQRQQMQQAAWWICLIFVLLTFRWVMFDSMIT